MGLQVPSGLLEVVEVLCRIRAAALGSVIVALVVALVASLPHSRVISPVTAAADAAAADPRSVHPPSAERRTADSADSAGTASTTAQAALVAVADAARYRVRTAPTGAEALNPRQGLHARFTPEGVRVTPARATGPTPGAPAVALSLTRYGYGTNWTPVGPGVLRVTGHRVEIARQAASRVDAAGVVEWYENRPSGLEQGFTLAARPEGAAVGEPLRVELRVTGGLRARPTDADDAIVFADGEGRDRVRYDHLVVTDHEGRTLDSRFEVGEGHLAILVADARAVYPLTIDPTFSQEAYLKASNAGALDGFGTAVAVSGDTLVVGADGEDSQATTVNGNQSVNHASGAGAAYVFVRDSAGAWSQQAYLKASNAAASDAFGAAVAISGDTIVVGAPGEDSAAVGVDGNPSDNGATGAGAAYVFVRTGTDWTQQAYLKASNSGANDSFGGAVAVSGDLVLVGAANEDSAATGVNGDQANNAASASGAAYVFARSGTVWTAEAYLKASNASPGDSFGLSLALDGATAVVGAQAEDSAASGVGGTQSDNAASDAGAVYVFVRSGGAWTQQAYLKASNTEAGDLFGHAVSISGNTIAVGADREDSSATGVGGDPSAGPADAAGAVYVFVRSGTVWSQQAYLKPSNTGISDQFGTAVSLSGDTLAVGATGEDSAAVGIGGDQGSNAASQSGAVYLFQRGVGAWAQRYYVKASNTGASDLFGSAVAIAGDIVVVGAAGEDSAAVGINGVQANNGALGAGAAYVLVRPPNRLPDALAGSDQAFTLAAGVTTADVMLDGSASSDPDGDSLAMQWSAGADQVVSTSVTANLTLPVGAHTFTLTVDDGNGGVSTDSVQITVRGTPALSWPAPPTGVFPVTLGAAHLTATADVPGTFAYTPAAGVVPAIGSHVLHVDFTPTDAYYDAASAEVTLTVLAPPVALAGADQVVPTTSGSAVVTLNGAASVEPNGLPLSYAWRNAAGQVLGTTSVLALQQGIGTQAFTLTVDNGVPGGVSTDGVVVAVRGIPTITWAPPAGALAPAVLGAAQLNASASVPGSFTYTPAAGTVLAAGTHQLRTVFVPTSAEYDSVTAEVPFTVAQAASVVTGQFSVTRGGFRLEQATGRFVQSVTIQFTGTSTLQGPVSLTLDGLTSGVTLFGAGGVTSCVAPAGSPYVAVAAGPDGVMTPGERVVMTLTFVNPLRKGITYTTRVLAGAGCR